jgi:hypothetical protein
MDASGGSWYKYVDDRMDCMGLEICLSAGVLSFTRYMLRAGPHEPNTISPENQAIIQGRASRIPAAESWERPYLDVVRAHDEWALESWLPFLVGRSTVIFEGDVLPPECRAVWQRLGTIAQLFWGDEAPQRKVAEWVVEASREMVALVALLETGEMARINCHLKEPIAALIFEINCLGGLYVYSGESTAELSALDEEEYHSDRRLFFQMSGQSTSNDAKTAHWV